MMTRLPRLWLGGDDLSGEPGSVEERVPDGSTVMDLQAVKPKDSGPAPAPDATKPAEAEQTKMEKAKQAQGDTRSAAEIILKKYMKRPRT